MRARPGAFWRRGKRKDLWKRGQRGASGPGGQHGPARGRSLVPNIQQTFASLGVRNYRLYFTGQGISLCGTWMQSIAQAWLVLKLTNSGTALGLITALQTLPVLLFGPWGGLVADRFPKRRTLYGTQGAAGLLALTLGILVATGMIQLWMMYILAPLLGFINVIDNPTRQTFVIEMVGKDQLMNAVSLNSSEVNLARIIGPAIAGVLIARIGLAPCFILNGLSYGAVLTMLFLMRSEELHTVAPVPRAKGQLIEGFRYVRKTTILRNTLLMLAIVGTLTYEFQVSLPLLARFTFHSGAGGFSALTAAMGAGAVLGGLLSANQRDRSTSALVKVALAFGATMLLVTVAPTLPLAVAAMVLVGVTSIMFTSFTNSTLQLESAPEMRGRVMSLWAVAFMGSTPIGGPIIGWIGEHAGARYGLAVGGVAAILAAGIGLAAMKRSAEPVPAEPAAPEVASAEPVPAEE